jgi:hypothetical protein
MYDLKTQFVPRSKHPAAVIETDKLMLFREIIAVLRSTQNTQTQNTEFLSVRAGGTYRKS